MDLILLTLVIIAFAIFVACLVSALVFLFFSLTIFLGAPYVPTPLKVVKRMIELAEPKPGETLYDLGSGDGRIIIGAAINYNLKAVGYEINPILVYYSREKIKRLGLKSKAKAYWGNFFRKNLSDADIVLVYLLQLTNNFLEKKFISQLKPGTRIVSLSFTFKDIPFVKADTVYPQIRLYQIPK